MAPTPDPAAPDVVGAPRVEIVLPVHNEERALAAGVRRLHAHLAEAFPWAARITIADNASRDGTWGIAQELAAELPGVRARRFDQRGRGRALHHTWMDSDAEVVAYMDIDLSTDLAALPPLVAPLISGHSDVAIGSRLTRGSRVVRGIRREVISRVYNRIVRMVLRTRFSDAQCGFKAMRADRARTLLPLVHDTDWFFDTELLVLAERAGMRIHEVPVDWVDDPDSRVHIAQTARDDLRGIWRLARGLATGSIPVREVRAALGREAPRRVGLGGQAVRFAAVGVASTVAYLALYVVLRIVMGPQAANLAALAVTQVANTATNRRFTFGVRGRAGAVRSQVESAVVFGIGLAMTSGSLALLGLLEAHPARALEVTVLVVANLLATLTRFVALRSWVFHPRRDRTAGEGAA